MADSYGIDSEPPRGLHGRWLEPAPVVSRINAGPLFCFHRETFICARPPAPGQMPGPMSLCANGMKKSCLRRCIPREVLACLLLVAGRAAVSAAYGLPKGPGMFCGPFVKGGGSYGPVARMARFAPVAMQAVIPNNSSCWPRVLREAEKARCPSLSMAVCLACHCPRESR